MKVLVAYASRHGATRGIAERVAEVLRTAGLEADLCRAEDVRAPAQYDAFVVGGSAYMNHWEKATTTLVHHHAELLRSRPTWLFSSGPLGTDRVDAKGQDVIAASVPKEFPELEDLVRPRDQAVFFGAYDPDAAPIGVMERLTRLIPASRDAVPTGDFRDWAAIEAWARGIADTLVMAPVAGGEAGV